MYTTTLYLFILLNGLDCWCQDFIWSGKLVDGCIPYGFGSAQYPNGDSFEGSFENGKRNGQGKYSYKNGAQYEGQYSQNQKTGFGIMKYPDQSTYEGSFYLYIVV